MCRSVITKYCREYGWVDGDGLCPLHCVMPEGCADSHFLARVVVIGPIEGLFLASTDQICQTPSSGSLALSYMHHISVIRTMQGCRVKLLGTWHGARLESRNRSWKPRALSPFHCHMTSPPLIGDRLSSPVKRDGWVGYPGPSGIATV